MTQDTNDPVGRSSDAEIDPEHVELRELLDRAGTDAAALPPAEVFRLARLMRRAAAELAAKRGRRGASDPSLERLERMVVRSRAVLSDRPGRRRTIGTFFREDYWKLIVERARPLGLSSLLLLLPAFVGFWWAVRSPEVVAGFLPEGFLWVREATTTDIGAGPVGLAGFSLFVMVNNIRVTLLTFILGVTWGLGTGWVIFQNGLILGGVAGLAVNAGNGELLVEAIIAHGILELSCIVIGGAAGLAVGRAMLRPGVRTRREALISESRAAVRIAVGTVPWLALAGVIEGFASRTGMDVVPASLIGLSVGCVFWWLVWRLGSGVPPASRV